MKSELDLKIIEKLDAELIRRREFVEENIEFLTTMIVIDSKIEGAYDEKAVRSYVMEKIRESIRC